MNILLVHDHYGVHEKRFTQAFVERGHSVYPISISALTSEHVDLKSLFALNDQPMVIFGGPLHLLDGIEKFAESVVIVAVSYAYDILYLAKHDSLAGLKINKVMSFCDGLVTDCNIVAHQALKYCVHSPAPPSCVAAWGLDRVAKKSADNGLLMQTVREQFGWPSDALVIVSIRHFTPLHGVSLLVDVFLKIASKQSNIYLLLVGDGEDRLNLQKSVADSGSCNRVGFLGCIDEAAIPRVLEQADLYVSASKVDGLSISRLQMPDSPSYFQLLEETWI
jgi:glycosyltransferase involved in cell wall biosynthesis